VANVIIVSLLHPTQSVPTQSWTFTDETTVSIGRATNNSVVLYSAVVSRHHVELRRGESGWRVVNLSTNGTYSSDGQPISKSMAIDGMVFRLATSGPRIQVNLGDSGNTDQPVIIDENATSEDLTVIDRLTS
jgi:pSer/pThr/pTyr-binding forkhead associated (FHA) protein